MTNNKYDLKFYTLEFLRSLACQSERKHLYKTETYENSDIHRNLRPKSRYQPDMTNVHPVYEDIRTKILNWVDNFEPNT